jgi:sugar O-acyltransferase (sialic acid O-acetyltransferase NeuD family)
MSTNGGMRPSAARAGKALYLAGSGSFAIEVADWARAGGWTVAGLIELLDASRVGAVVGNMPVVAPEPVPAGAVAAVAAGGSREAHWMRVEAHGWRPATIVHPAAHVSPTAQLGAGCVVAPGAVIGAETTIGSHALISRGTLVGHHAHVGDFVSLMPGVNVGGHTQIGERAVVGMGAVIVNTTTVGPDATVAAGAVVLRDIRSGTRVQGLPAREYVR